MTAQRVGQESRHNILMPLKRKEFSLRNLPVQLSLIAIGIPTLVLVLFGVFRIHTQTNILENELKITLKNEIVQLSASLSTALFNFDDETCKVISEAALKKSEILKITVWDLEQEYLSFQDDFFTMVGNKSEIRTIEYPILFKNEKIGKVQIVATTIFLDASIARLKKSSVIQVIVLDLILGLVLIVVLNIRFVRPLQDLQQSSEKIATGQLDYPINVHRNDELGALADNLVMMRDAVKEKMDSLQSEVDQHQKTSIALEKSESFLRLIIDLIPHMIFVKNMDGRYLVVNQAVAYDLDTSVEALTGRLHSEVSLDPESAKKMLKDDQMVIETGKTLSLLTETHLASTKESKWYSTKKIPFTAPDGDKGVVGITIDITELKQAEEELKKTKNYIDNIINSMPSALFSLDRELNIVLWNYKAEKIFGITSGSAINNYLGDVLKRMKPFLENINNTIKTGEPHYFPKQITQTKEGIVYEDITVYPLIGESIEGAVIRVDDVTEHVRMEEMVVQSEKMLSIGGLAAGMAHEINNPLAGMMQNAQVAMRRIQGEIPASIQAAEEVGISMDQIREFMEKRGMIRQLGLIHEAGIRASKIVQNMLSFSRKDFSGKTQQDIADLLEQTLELAKSDYDLKRKYDFKKIKIVREFDENAPLVMCEVSKMQQVFFNILKNSAEAMQELETLTDPTFYLRVKSRGSFVRIEIEDNGPGMIEDIRKRIFEPFFTTKPVGKGTGLGLSIVKKLVIQMGGTVQLQRNEANGTTVTFTLIADKCESAAAVPATTNSPAPILTSPGRRLSVLVVEDELINRQILQAILTKFGHQTTVAEDGRIALELLKSNYFDIILMDVQMPELDGIETTKIIRTSPSYQHTRNVPIIALTAYAMADDKDKCLQAGMNNYLAKPVDIKILERSLKNLTTVN
ncbi:MAG: response regulator [Desulfobacula sp.]|nr:response regulator [Desulfobacula sp.]